ncbi:TPT-domain-containing protein [Artomyces pyxidatus]|uniref:TPT-domain-containing protein n=1 Tax=Artomyces pyxidatus TaxID=48021 RepID=A0ACB8SLW9_9AGAM|nr:TPT-domain-containing protein [Artomyces pyxidatus]
MSNELVYTKLSTCFPPHNSARRAGSDGHDDDSLQSNVYYRDQARRLRTESTSSAVRTIWARKATLTPAVESCARIRLNTFSSSDSATLPLPSLCPSNSRSDLASQISDILSSPATRRRSLKHLLSSTGLQKVTRYSESQSFWLSLYFFLNLVLTLYNKTVLVSFPFPYTLTALHALAGSLGGRFLLQHEFYEPQTLSVVDHIILSAFSVLYSVNIAISNVSLDLVTVPFHQVVRAATPIFTTFISWYFFNAHFSAHKLASLVPVIAGVGLATYGDYYFTTWGFLLTLFGTFLAAFKTIATHLLQSPPLNAPTLPHPLQRTLRLPTPFLPISVAIPRFPTLRPSRLNLHPLDLLTRMSPLAFAQCIFYAHIAGELDILRYGQDDASAYLYSRRPATYSVFLAINALIAFGLNVVSFEANRRAGALSMGVAANVKQVLTVMCAVSLFHLTITPANALGVALTLFGGAWYAAVEYREKAARQRTGSCPMAGPSQRRDCYLSKFI